MATNSSSKPSGSQSSTEKSIPDQAVEALVYAPVGLALEILDQVPGWVTRGKSQVTLGRLFAKMAVEKGQNEFGDAVNDVMSDIFGIDLRPEAGDGDVIDAKATEAAPKPTSKVKASPPKTKPSEPKAAANKPKASTSAAKSTSKPANKPKTARATKASKATKPKATKAKAKATKTKAAKSTKTKSPKAKSPKAKAPKAKAPKNKATVDLGLESYDTLSASQIVKRLGALSAKQLEAVREHEEAGRHRVTVLNRIRQIQRES